MGQVVVRAPAGQLPSAGMAEIQKVLSTPYSALRRGAIDVSIAATIASAGA